MAYNSGSRSERLLQNRRFTTDDIGLTQEAFTSVLDINSSEVYTDFRYIPTSSAKLSFSGSSQDLLIVSASNIDPSIETDLPVLKYWYRKKLKPGATNREVFYFTLSDPATPTDTTSDQLIATDQLTNFISPKYIIPGDSSKTAEANPPGYKISVATGSDASTAVIQTDEKFVFDYKTGVLSWVSGITPGNTHYVFVSIYQYVGRTLDSQLRDGSLSGGGGTGAGFPFSGSAVITGSLSVSGSNVNFTLATGVSGAFSGSFSGDGSGLTNLSNVVYTNLADNAIQNIGGTLKLTGDIIAENFVVSSSVFYFTESFASGSTKFGNSEDDTHQFTGSLQVSGALKLKIATDITSERTPLVIDTNGNIYIANGDFVTSAETGTYELKISSSGDNNLITITNSEALIISGAGGLSVTSNTNTLTIRAGGGILSSSAQIATDISGAFTSVSSSLASRIDTNTTNISNLQTSGSAGFVISSSGGQFNVGAYQTASFTGGTSGISVTSDTGNKRITIGASGDNVIFNTLKIDNTPSIGFDNNLYNPILLLSSSDSISQDTGLSFISDTTLRGLKISGSTLGNVLYLGDSTKGLSISYLPITNQGALTFPSASNFILGKNATDYHVYISGSSTGKVVQLSGSLFLENLTNTNSSNVLVYNTTTGQVTYDTTYNSSITTLNSVTGSIVSLNAATSSYLLNSQTGSGFESLVIKGDLVVNGTTTYINVNNLLVEDKFILLNSGSTGSPSNEGGIIVQTTNNGSGSAFFYDSEANRWALTRSGSIAGNTDSITLGATTEFVVTISSSASGPASIPINFGTTDTYRAGQMHINTDTGDIWIYS